MDALDDWRLFAAAARLRSFGRAAAESGRSPQVATRAIARLEARLGRRLFHRTTRAVRLTDDGERALVQCQRALAEFDQLERPSDEAPLQGRLTLSAPVRYGELYVLPLVTRFLEQAPLVEVRLTLLDRVVSLAEEGIDLSVRIGELRDSALIARRIGQVRRIVCASPAYLAKHGTPRAPRDLARHACISFSPLTAAGRWSFPGRGRREESVAVQPRLTVNTAQAAVGAAAAGLGLVRVLSYQAEELIARQKLRVVLRRFEPPPVPVQWLHGPGPLSRPARAFLEAALSRASC